MVLKKRGKYLLTWTAACVLTAAMLTGCGGKTDTAESNSVEADVTDAEDTVVGSWTMTGMLYNGTEYTKEDIENADAGITLELSADGTGVMKYEDDTYELTWDEQEISTEDGPTKYMLKDGMLITYEEGIEMYFSRVGSTNASLQNQKTDSVDTTAKTAETSIEDTWTITPLASSLDLVPYSCTEFSMNIPQGWVVEEAPAYAGMFHEIRVYDPEKPINQILFMLKAEPLFPNETVQSLFGMQNQIYGMCPVLTNVSTEGFFQVFSQYATALDANEIYSSVHTPHIENFSVQESFVSNSSMSSQAISPALLRATFTQDGLEGEGMFTADIIPFALDLGTGYYMAYNVAAITAEKDTFQDWEQTLGKSLASLNYTQEFVNIANSQSNQGVSTAQSLSQAASETSDMIMSSWENRNTSQDIISQKQSDATMGYERIQDTETGEIYKIDNGFMDHYDGERYRSITDEQYTEEVKAVIHL